MILQEYIITPPSTMARSVTVGYDAESGVLQKIEFQGNDAKAVNAFCQLAPVTEQELQQLAKARKWKLQQLDIDLSFERFYELYGNKVGKKRAQVKWKRMPKTEKVKALLYIKHYDQQLKLQHGVQKMYPESYLNAERWND